jgi:hypothetical protein
MSVRLIVTSMVLFLAACDAAAPEYVYVRTSSVMVTLTVHSEPRVRLGDWLRLGATRATSGEWRKVRFAEMPKDTPWLAYVPPSHEPDVAASLRWFAEPSEGVEFDNPATGAVPLTQRGVRFAKPGEYRLWATSHAPVDARSNTLQIEVTARD